MLGLLLRLTSIAATAETADAAKTNVYVGIDLGTTYSCVSMYIPETGVYEYLTYGQDFKEIFPSTVFVSGFSEETKRPIVSVGYEANALNAQDPSPDAYFYGHKRMMGISSFERNPDLKKFPSKVTYKVLPRGPNKEEGYGEHFVFPYYPKGSKEPKYFFTPRSLAVEILRYFKSRIEELNYNIVSTVVSTPAYFTIDQDHETALAANLAGLGDVLITKEPVAACVYYTREENLKLDEEMQVLVFDFGGGTLDISVVYVERTLNDDEETGKNAAINKAATINNITVNEYIGDNFLGGENINDELVAHFISKMGGKSLDAVDGLRLRLFAEEFKIKLCLATASDYSVSFSKTFVTKDGGEYPFTMTGHDFNKICKPVFDRIETLFTDSKTGLFRMRGAGEKSIRTADIQKVVFVGGSTRIPYIRDLVKKLCPTAELHFKTDADKSVARGACEICVNKDPNSGVSSMVVMGAVPLSVGIRLEGDTFHPLLKKSEPIPCSASEIFTTVIDGQTNISVQVAIGERTMFVDNISIGELTLTLSSQMPRGVPKVKVEISMDEFYAISVKAVDMSSKDESNNVTAKFDSKYGKPSQDKIDKMLEDAKKNAEADKEIRAKAQLYSTFSGAVDQLDKLLAAPTTKLSSDDKVHADAVLQTSKEWIGEHRNDWTLDAAVIEGKINSLKQEVEKIYRQIEAAMSAEGAGAPSGEQAPVSEPEARAEDKEAGREVL